MDDQPTKSKIKISFGSDDPSADAPEEAMGKGEDYYKEKLMEVKGLLESGDGESALNTINECLNEQEAPQLPEGPEGYNKMGDSPMPAQGGIKLKFK